MGTTGFDMMGNQALQEHWLRRVVAIILDSIIVFIPIFILGFFLWFFGIFAWGWLTWGVIFFLYSFVLDLVIGGTIGKKLMNLRVIGVQKHMDVAMAIVRNISKIVFILVIIDWIVGLLTEGDPRQKYTDRLIGCTVTRTDQGAYMEEQFKVAQYYRPPPVHGYQPYQQPSHQPQQAPQTAEPAPAESSDEGWASADQPDTGAPKPKFCEGCGSPLNERPDGRMQCPACGRIY
jgi:uncharacterized RDD family membrane protein YckC